MSFESTLVCPIHNYYRTSYEDPPYCDKCKKLKEKSTIPPEKKQRANYLTTVQAYNLEVAAYPLVKATWDMGYGIYHVGSSITRPDWRDVDLRLIMDNDKFDVMFGKRYSHLHMFLNAVISEWLATRSGLPIDFQFQRQKESNEEFSSKNGHPRNAVGISLMHFSNDTE